MDKIIEYLERNKYSPIQINAVLKLALFEHKEFDLKNKNVVELFKTFDEHSDYCNTLNKWVLPGLKVLNSIDIDRI